jgi:UDP-N-acetyl-D-glucosamine/UDP-N-acetyl-D-galactosamine dehydrogenase
MNISNRKIAIIGLGYVGLPLAVAFAEKYLVVGFDINQKRVKELSQGNDSTLEIPKEQLKTVVIYNSKKEKGLYPTCKLKELKDCKIYIVTVPTPTDKHNRPVLTPMIKASESVAKVLKKGDVVIYESTVYPGVTEDEMVPILEVKSGLKYNEDFFVGYSPERINPGDKEHTVTKILKVTSGSTPESAKLIDDLYKEIIVAEAAKVIENSQRDINIAFVNELSKIFNLLGIDTLEVLEAAGTKWNFLPFKPGLVGGHCIGVDPFYLAQKAQEVGYHPEIILAGRRLNDSMGKHVATEVIKHMMRKDLKVIDSKVLILGFTFKEDCPDVRNTRVIDIYQELKSYDMDVCIYDPWADSAEVKHEYGIEVINGGAKPVLGDYAAIILAVAHKEFKSWPIQKSENQVVFDVKSVLEKEKVDARL